MKIRGRAGLAIEEFAALIVVSRPSARQGVPRRKPYSEGLQELAVAERNVPEETLPVRPEEYCWFGLVSDVSGRCRWWKRFSPVVICCEIIAGCISKVRDQTHSEVEAAVVDMPVRQK